MDYKMIIAIGLAVGSLHASDAFSQDSLGKRTFEPAFKNLAFEEDYSALANPELRDNFWKKIKYIPLYKNGYLSFGGELRPRMEIRSHLNYGKSPEDRGVDFQQRSRIWTDWHIAKGFRAFAELQSGTTYGLEAPAAPTDKNQIEVHQAFGEYYKNYSADKGFNIRVGRQEIAFGKARIFDTRTPPNNRHSFDAGRIGFHLNGWRFDGLIGMEVKDNIGAFNDGWNKNFTFFAAHLERKLPTVLPGSTMELLYVHTNRKVVPTSTFYGSRNTLSARLSGLEGHLNYDVEFIGQAGKGVNDESIKAWYIGSETSYNLPGTWKPYIGYKLDIGSGDQDSTDHKNNSYDFLWSRGISWGSDLGYTNLTALGPSLGIKPTHKLSVDFWAQWLWRTSTQDGIYKMSDAYQRTAAVGTSKYVGFRNLLKIEYQLNPYLLFGTYFNRTFKGSYLKEDTNNKDLFYGMGYIIFRF